MKFTGERLIPGIPRIENMIVEELGRLHFAKVHFQNVAALDFGCGTGYAANFMLLHGANFVVGIDICSDSIRFAQQQYGNNRLAYVRMNCLNSGLRAVSFGFICSMDVIEHFAASETDRFLSEIERLLIPNGYCLITTPNRLHSSPNSQSPSWKFHLREFYYDDFKAVLSQHFSRVEIFGSRVPIYEDRAIRKITNSPLSHLKHFLPATIRVGFSSGLRYLLKPQLTIEDVTITKEDVNKARVFVALCQK